MSSASISWTTHPSTEVDMGDKNMLSLEEDEQCLCSRKLKHIETPSDLQRIRCQVEEHWTCCCQGVFFLIFRPTLFLESNRIKRIDLRIVTYESESCCLLVYDQKHDQLTMIMQKKNSNKFRLTSEYPHIFQLLLVWLLKLRSNISFTHG